MPRTADPGRISCPRCRRLLARQEGANVEVRDRRAVVRLRVGVAELDCSGCGLTVQVELKQAPHELRILVADA